MLEMLPAQAQKNIPFVTGADLSYLPYYESRGVRYFDGGKASGLLDIAREIASRFSSR